MQRCRVAAKPGGVRAELRVGGLGWVSISWTQTSHKTLHTILLLVFQNPKHLFRSYCALKVTIFSFREVTFLKDPQRRPLLYDHFPPQPPQSADFLSEPGSEREAKVFLRKPGSSY